MTVVDAGRLVIASIFYGSIDMVEFLTMWPRYYSSARPNALFLRFALSLCSRNLVSTQRKCSAWSSSFFEKTSILSRYTVAKMSSFSARTWSMSRWNVAGALTSPNGSTVYSYKPHWDWKTVRCWSLSATLTWWYGYVRSIFEYTVEPPSLSNILSIWGIGYLSMIAFAFKVRKSMHMQSSPPFLGTNSIGWLYCEWLGWIQPLASNLSIYFFASSSYFCQVGIVCDLVLVWLGLVVLFDVRLVWSAVV